MSFIHYVAIKQFNCAVGCLCRWRSGFVAETASGRGSGG